MSTLDDRRAALAVAQTEQSAPNGALSLLNVIAAVASDPAADVNRLKVLLDMQREIIADERRIAFHRAMGRAQAEMRAVLRDGANTETRSRYPTYEAYDRAIRPIYTAHGFSVTFESEPIAGGVRIWCEVAHEAGHTKMHPADVPFDMTGPKGAPNKTAVHGWKSAVTYGRRAALEMAFNLASADDDGNAAGSPGDAGEIIARAQAAELRRLIAECSADPRAAEANERRFLDRMQLPTTRSIEDVRPGDFKRLRTALLTKRARIQEAAQQAA